MAFFKSCTDEQLLALREVQKLSGVNLRDKNPYSSDFDSTPSGQAVRVALEANHPLVAAEFKSTAEGFTQSLDAELFNRGKADLTQGIHAELLGSDPVYQKQYTINQAAEEERLLAKMEAEAQALAAQRGVDLSAPRPDVNPAMTGKFSQWFEYVQQQKELDAQD